MPATVCPHCQRDVDLGSGTFCALTLCPHCGDTFYPPPPPPGEPEPPVLEPASVPAAPAVADLHCTSCAKAIRGRARRVLQTCRRCRADFCSEACLRQHQKFTGHGRRRSRASGRSQRPVLTRPDRCPECDSDDPPFCETKMSQTGLIVMLALLVMFFPLFWIGLLIRDEFYVCRDCGWRAPGPNNSNFNLNL